MTRTVQTWSRAEQERLWNAAFAVHFISSAEKFVCCILTLILPITTIVPYANTLSPAETPGYSASHPDQSCLTLGLVSQTLNVYEALLKLMQTRHFADDIFRGQDLTQTMLSYSNHEYFNSDRSIWIHTRYRVTLPLIWDSHRQGESINIFEETVRETERQRHINRQTDRRTYRYTERHRHTDWQTERERERERDREREREIKYF